MPFGKGAENPRTVAMEAKLHDFALKAQQWALNIASEKGINPYDVEIERETFLEDFAYSEETTCTIYASKRYYKRFVFKKWFIEKTHDDNGEPLTIPVFQLNPKFADKRIYGVKLPEDKPLKKPKRAKKP